MQIHKYFYYRVKTDRKGLTVEVEDASDVDVAEVVRCRDCRHRDPEDHKCDCGHDILWQLPRDDNWFCADGERKEEEKHEDLYLKRCRQG